MSWADTVFLGGHSAHTTLLWPRTTQNFAHIPPFALNPDGGPVSKPAKRCHGGNLDLCLCTTKSDVLSHGPRGANSNLKHFFRMLRIDLYLHL